jgi:hypothetical protein
MEVLRNLRETKNQEASREYKSDEEYIYRVVDSRKMESTTCPTSLKRTMLFFLPTQQVPHSRHWQNKYISKIYAKFVLGKAMVRSIRE